MKIGIDARFYGPVGKGLGRYTQKLIDNLEKIDSENEYYVFLRKTNFEDYQPKRPNFRKVMADFNWYGWEEQWYFPRLLNRYKFDLVHFLHFNVPILYNGRFIVTIHDLILLHFPTIRSSTLQPLMFRLKYSFYRMVIKSALKRSARIITVSNFTKKDILENFKRIPQEKIIVTYEACDDFCMLSPNKDEEILSRCGIIKPYLMYVGNAYPHKNLDRLVLAFEMVQKEIPHLKLVLTGKSDYFYKRLRDFVKSRKIKNVIFSDFIPDHELDTLFHNTELYVWPSLYEGFGLPPLEAMAKGAPVISNDHPCMREVLGDSVYYFDGTDVDSISKAIIKLYHDKVLRAKMIRAGYEHITKFSWKETAKETLRIYNKININA